LEEPAKLKRWLCGIVRNLSQNWVRSQTRNPLATALSLEEELAAGPEWDVPSDQAISKEEEAILWRVLETLPRAYRDALVLFYRSGDSTAEVADALALSEEAVRQRLARGRAMLSERVARVVERGLRRTNPTKAFTAAVLGALPLASAQAGMVGTTATATAQGAGTLKVAGVMGGFIAAVANVVAVLGGLIGLWGHIESSRSQRERRFLAWSTWGFVCCVAFWILGLMVGMGLFVEHQIVQFTTRLSDAIGLSLLWLGLAAPMDAYVIWMARRQLRIRAEQAQTAERSVEVARRGYKVSIYGAMLAMVFGATEWLFLLAHRSQEWATIFVLLLVTLAGWLVGAKWAVKRPASRAQVFIVLWWGLAVVNLATANLRWESWYGERDALAPPGVNLLILVCFGSMRAGWWLKQRL
jgi:RNA polymerase sigma factor (sigma-70 family)